MDTDVVDPAIELVDLVKRYGQVDAVRGVTLSVPRGCTFGFVGPNGAGKTTTFRMLAGLLLPTSGRVRLLGRDMGPNAVDLKRRLGVVPDQPSLFERLTLAELLQIQGRVYGLDEAVIDERASALVGLLDLGEASRRPISEYSHGMKKRASLAAALPIRTSYCSTNHSRAWTYSASASC